MFSEISFPVPSQQMMMFRMVMLPRYYRSEYSAIWDFGWRRECRTRLIHGIPGVRRLSGRLGDGTNLQVHAGLLLQCADDAEQVFGGGISVRSEHPHQALWRTLEHHPQPVEPNC